MGRFSSQKSVNKPSTSVVKIVYQAISHWLSGVVTTISSRYFSSITNYVVSPFQFEERFYHLDMCLPLKVRHDYNQQLPYNDKLNEELKESGFTINEKDLSESYDPMLNSWFQSLAAHQVNFQGTEIEEHRMWLFSFARLRYLLRTNYVKLIQIKTS